MQKMNAMHPMQVFFFAFRPGSIMYNETNYTQDPAICRGSV